MRYRFLLWLLPVAFALRAEIVSETWGGAGTACTYPGTLKVIQANATRLVFDLSAIPADATVNHASLSYFGAGSAQPRDPVQVFVADKLEGDKASHAGQSLPLEAPWYRSLDATSAVQQWVKNPAANLGFVVARFDCLQASQAFLAVRYSGTANNAPPQVTGLSAVHKNGQTFLVWKELPVYRPAADKIVWIDKFSGMMPAHWGKEPGADAQGRPFIPAITLKDLRDLQGVAVREEPVGGQQLPPQQRVRQVPAVRYRVYRSGQKITPVNIHLADCLGEATALCAYQDLITFWIACEGEYYKQRERPEAVVPTFCVGDSKPVLPGEAFYVHTPKDPGACYYAVTAVQDGTENMVQISAENSLEASVAEAPATPQPVFQYAGPNHYTAGAIENWYCYWLAPPLANLSDNWPRRIGVSVPAKFAAPGPMVIKSGSSWDWFYGFSIASPTAVELLIGQDIPYGGDLCYNAGRGTLRSFQECRVEYLSQAYVLSLIDWALSQWQIDRARISSGLSTHFTIRHPELFKIMWLDPYALDFDHKWNPGSGSLPSRLGPSELAQTVDGQRAWDVFDIPRYLARDPGKDIPFFACFFNQPKDGNHGAEYGWQDDPKGLAALRDAREPFAASWGGPDVSPELRAFLSNLRWDKSIPSFSHCSLDNSPGNGDPDDGEPFGLINGYLLWQYDDIVDEPDRWEMTVYLAPRCPDLSCTVDITPRHCRQFKLKPGDSFVWTNTPVGQEAVKTGEVIADKWSLVTLTSLEVTKQKNRLVIKRK